MACRAGQLTSLACTGRAQNCGIATLVGVRSALVTAPAIALDFIHVGFFDKDKPKTIIENGQFDTNQQPFKHSDASRDLAPLNSCR